MDYMGVIAQMVMADIEQDKAAESQNHIEQHNFDRLVAQGFICVNPTPWPDVIAQGMIVEGAAARKALPPKGAGMAISTT